MHKNIIAAGLAGLLALVTTPAVYATTDQQKPSAGAAATQAPVHKHGNTSSSATVKHNVSAKKKAPVRKTVEHKTIQHKTMDHKKIDRKTVDRKTAANKKKAAPAVRHKTTAKKASLTASKRTSAASKKTSTRQHKHSLSHKSSTKHSKSHLQQSKAPKLAKNHAPHANHNTQPAHKRPPAQLRTGAIQSQKHGHIDASAVSYFDNNSNNSRQGKASTSRHSQRVNVAKKTAMTKLMHQLGKPYRWGGHSPGTGFDCSGLVYFAYKDLVNFPMPRTADAMYHLRDAAPVPRDQLKKGDLVFFHTENRALADHVGVYIGDNKFIQSPRTGEDVQITSLNDSYWQQHYIGARRIVTPKTVAH